MTDPFRRPCLAVGPVLFFLVVSGAAQNHRPVSVEGTVVCLGSLEQPVPCMGHSGDFALETDAGERYFFTREDPRSRIFEDPRVWEQRLRVDGWEKSDNRIEIIEVYSVKQGRLFDIQYFCSICNITAYAGGPCWCCQQDFEFREILVEDDAHN